MLIVAVALLLVGLDVAAVRSQQQDVAPAADDPPAPPAVEALLARAAAARDTLAHAGDLVVVSFSDQGPRIARLEVAADADGLRIAGEAGAQLGRVGDRGLTRSTPTLLQVGGAERIPVRTDRLQAKYVATVGLPVDIDTGPAVPIRLRERSTDVLREALYADQESGLIVRRETYARDGLPVRVVAYTDLALLDQPPAPTTRLRLPQPTGPAADAATLREAGFVVPTALPLGYELVTALDVTGARVPTLHLIYGDGMYTMSVFQQRGRMAATATAGATELRTSTGGAVWRWPGSEPRQIVWTGGGATFTVLADTPTDELLEAISGLPADPSPGILDRLDRGLARVIRWISPTDRSNT